MPREQLVYDVFLASPSDVSEERNLVGEVVQEVNRTYGDDNGVHFNLIQWESHVYPNFGSDVQGVINTQIDGRFDVFIGVLWSRLGQRTPRAQSGTEEEFNIAFDKFKKKEVSNIQMYFKTKEIPINEIDVNQIKKIRKFKKRVGDLGGLYAEFVHALDFKEKLKSNLILLTKNLRGKDSNIKKNSPVSKYDEHGVLELMQLLESNQKTFVKSMSRIGGWLAQMTQSIQKKTGKINGLQIEYLNRQIPPQKLIPILDSTAKDMDRFSDETTDELPGFSRSFSALLEIMAQLVRLEKMNKSEKWNNLKQSMAHLVSQVSGSSAGCGELRIIIQKLPPATGKFKRAQRNIVDTLLALEGEMNIAIEVLTKMMQ